MSIKDLELKRKEYFKYAGDNYQAEIHLFMTEAINTFKDLQTQLDKKEDKIAIKDIKELRT